MSRRHHFHPHCDERVHPIVAFLNEIIAKGKQAMATMQQVLDDLNGFAQEVTDYVAARDKIDDDLKAQLAAATASGGVATQDQVDAAFTAAEAAKASLAPPSPPTA